MTSPRIRPALRRVAFSDRAGQSLTVLRACYDRGVELPAEPDPKPGERGAGKPLPQEW